MKIKTFLCLLLFASSAFSQSFTPTQISALRADAQANAQACIASGDDGCVANYLNSQSAFVVWKTNIRVADVYALAGFDFTLVDGLTQGKRDEWRMLFTGDVSNPSQANIRAGYVDVWSGTTPKVAVQTAILTYAKRFATNAEKVLATGTGTTVAPANLTWEGLIQPSDIANILGR